jgi:uncharacterized coiled-coil protein SlyX
MKRSSISYHLLLGMLCGILLLPPTAQAQFTVYDPANHATQIEEAIKDAARWLETIDKYAKDIEYYAKQLKSMTDLNKTVADHLGYDLLRNDLVNRIGTLVVGAMQLYAQLDRLVYHRIQFLKNIDADIRRGRFDALNFKTWYEAYLKDTIGRSSRDSVSNVGRMAKADAQLAALLDEQQKVQAQLAAWIADVKTLQKQLSEERERPVKSQRDISHLTAQIAHYFAIIEQLSARLAEINRRIDEHVTRHAERIGEMENFAKQILVVNDGWDTLVITKQKIAQQLSDLVIGR